MSIRPLLYDKHVLSIHDLQYEASRKLPKVYREYYIHGATDIIRLLEDPSRCPCKDPAIDTSAELFGCKVKFPLGFSPNRIGYALSSK
ncbi:hypothetical protein AARAC_001011 [Aspergillus arachidicola]|uniref:Uncharacterized protein n=1 Tax=Aspergillus arachidicola TaxID=656916 RepID=A0A2G7G6S5_9EURO|nr:hypothetical protein AARAC_001011 [Aspergillus arachidicola]